MESPLFDDECETFISCVAQIRDDQENVVALLQVAIRLAEYFE